jgi:hypothetical protein
VKRNVLTLGLRASELGVFFHAESAPLDAIQMKSSRPLHAVSKASVLLIPDIYSLSINIAEPSGACTTSHADGVLQVSASSSKTIDASSSLNATPKSWEL